MPEHHHRGKGAEGEGDGEGIQTEAGGPDARVEELEKRRATIQKSLKTPSLIMEHPKLRGAALKRPVGRKLHEVEKV